MTTTQTITSLPLITSEACWWCNAWVDLRAYADGHLPPRRYDTGTVTPHSCKPEDLARMGR